jgi:ribosomal protein L11 methyltransferase
MENVALNHCENIRIQKGTIADFAWTERFDIILANINRNILLAEMPRYAEYLLPSGVLQLSGFYVKDIPDLSSEAERYGLTPVTRDEKEEWATLRFGRIAK